MSRIGTFVLIECCCANWFWYRHLNNKHILYKNFVFQTQSSPSPQFYLTQSESFNLPFGFTAGVSHSRFLQFLWKTVNYKLCYYALQIKSCFRWRMLGNDVNITWKTFSLLFNIRYLQLHKHYSLIKRTPSWKMNAVFQLKFFES